jgi:hypothetical protein
MQKIQVWGRKSCRRSEIRTVESETTGYGDEVARPCHLTNDQRRGSDLNVSHIDMQGYSKKCLVPSGWSDVNGRTRLGSRQDGGGESGRRMPRPLLGCRVYGCDNQVYATRKSRRRVPISRKQHTEIPLRRRRARMIAKNKRGRRVKVQLVFAVFVVQFCIALTMGTLIQAGGETETGNSAEPVGTDPKDDSEQSVMELLIGRPFVGYPQHPVKVPESVPSGDPVQVDDGVKASNNGVFAKGANYTSSNASSNVFDKPPTPVDLRHSTPGVAKAKPNWMVMTPAPNKPPLFFSDIPSQIPSRSPDPAGDRSFHRETLSDVPSVQPSISLSPSPRIRKSRSETMQMTPVTLASARDGPHMEMGMITSRSSTAASEGRLDAPPKRQMKVTTAPPTGPVAVGPDGQPHTTHTRRMKRKARNIFARVNTTVSTSFNVTRVKNHQQSNAWTRQRQWHLGKHLTKKSGKKKSKRSRKKHKGKARKRKGMGSASSKVGKGRGKGIRTGCPTPASRTTAVPTSSPFPTGSGFPPTSVPTRDGGIIATPTSNPTSLSTTLMPTLLPTTASPTALPTTASPTAAPTTASPTVAPTTASPTGAPSSSPPPSAAPTVFPFQRFQTSVELQAAVDQYMLGGNNQMAMVCRVCHVDSCTRVDPEITALFVFIFCVMSLLAQETIYGPVEAWDVANVTDFSSLFDAMRNANVATFNGNIAGCECCRVVEVAPLTETSPH